MKQNFLIASLLIFILAACQAVPPLPTLTITDGEEFTLAVDQSATTTDGALTLRFIGVGGDQRCPSELECAVSGPVSVSLSVQENDAPATEIALQTFTDNDGRAPEGPFEGIQDRVKVAGYEIRVRGVLPYPAKSFNEIRDAKYLVTLTITEK